MRRPAPRVPAKVSPMKLCLSSSLVLAAMAPALLPAAPAAAQSVTKPRQEMVLSIGRGQLITVPGRMTDVFVADDKIADVQIKSTNQLYVMAKGPGVTTVYASDGAGNVIFSANVRVGSNIDSVDQMLRVAMPDAKIAVSTFGADTVLLTGTIGAPEDAAEAQRLVQAFMGKTTNVISRLKTATPLQVNLQVRIAEVARTLVKSIGVNLTSIDATGGFQFGIGQGRSGFSPIFAPNTATGIGQSVKVTLPNGSTIDGTNVLPVAGSTTLAGAGSLFGLNLLGALDAGETVGLVTTLAQPNLTAISGETADFLAGGEFPYLVSQGANQPATVQFKRFGVSLSYTPTVLSNGRISLRVRPEVSELGDTIKQGGYDVPSLVTRRAETTIELGSGQSFMIGGLMRATTSNRLNKMPGAGDVPILGSLFRSSNFQRGETELVIVVTPYLVQPVDGNAIKLPTDGYQTPNEIQRLFGNMQSDGRTGQQRPVPTEAPARQAPGGTTPAPKIGAAEAPAQPAPALAADAPPRSGGKRKPAGESVQPGFSLK